MKYVCNVCGWVYDEDEAGVKLSCAAWARTSSARRNKP